MPESLENQFISDLYTSLLHLSGAELGPNGPLNKVFDGDGNSTGLALSGERVIVNNYIYPQGFTTRKPLEWLDSFFPVGCLQLTLDENNPTDRIAGTTWVQVAKGRFLVGTGTGTDKNGLQREFCPGGVEEEEAGLRGGSGDTRGEYEVGLTRDQLPAHTHNVDVGAVDVQVPNPAGTATTLTSRSVATENSTLSFREQVQARFSLGRALNLFVTTPPLSIPLINLNDTSLSTDSDTYPWAYALDLEFKRGSAKSYDDSIRQEYETGDIADMFKFKEMVGIWNGESRFVSDVKVKLGEVNGEAIRSAKTPYEIAIELGAVDIGAAEAGQLVTTNNELPTISGPTEVLNSQEDTNNTRVTAAVGLDASHNNILPSYGVYVWKRIA
jgi:hypothetical protein